MLWDQVSGVNGRHCALLMIASLTLPYSCVTRVYLMSGTIANKFNSGHCVVCQGILKPHNTRYLVSCFYAMH